jgi:hypothetical protein
MVRLDANHEKERIVKIAIIGAGIVGNNMKKIFPKAIMIDCKEGFPHVTPEWVDLAFVCVPTPQLPSGACDYRSGEINRSSDAIARISFGSEQKTQGGTT